MPIAAPTAGSRILTTDLASFYNLLKGVSGSGETITLVHNSGSIVLQPTSDPSAGTEAFIVKNAAGTVLGAITYDGKFEAADGTVGAPGITFDDDTDTGFYRTGANAVSFAAGGVLVAPLAVATATARGFVPTPPNNTTDFLRGDATWAAPTSTAVVKSVDYSSVVTEETTTSTSFVDLATVGPTVTVIAAASDNLDASHKTQVVNNTGGAVTVMAPKLDAVATADDDGALMDGTIRTTISNVCRFAAVSAASHTVKIQYRVTAGTGTFARRKMILTRSQ